MIINSLKFWCYGLTLASVFQGIFSDLLWAYTPLVIEAGLNNYVMVNSGIRELPK